MVQRNLDFILAVPDEFMFGVFGAFRILIENAGGNDGCCQHKVVGCSDLDVKREVLQAQKGQQHQHTNSLACFVELANTKSKRNCEPLTYCGGI